MGGGLPYDVDGDACRLTKGCKCQMFRHIHISQS